MLTTTIGFYEKWHDNDLGAKRRPLRSSQGEVFINAATCVNRLVANSMYTHKIPFLDFYLMWRNKEKI